MINLYRAEADDILAVLLYGAPFLSMLTARTIIVSLLKMSGNPMTGMHTDKLRRFFGSDVVLFMLTLVTSGIVVIAALNAASLDYILEVLSVMRREWGAIGWLVSFIWCLHVTAPCIVGLMLVVGRHRRIKKYGHMYNH